MAIDSGSLDGWMGPDGGRDVPQVTLGATWACSDIGMEEPIGHFYQIWGSTETPPR